MKKIKSKYKRFKFNYEDYERLFTIDENVKIAANSLKTYASKGKFNPNDIKSIVEFYIKWIKKKNKEC